MFSELSLLREDTVWRTPNLVIVVAPRWDETHLLYHVGGWSSDTFGGLEGGPPPPQ